MVSDRYIVVAEDVECFGCGGKLTVFKDGHSCHNAGWWEVCGGPFGSAPTGPRADGFRRSWSSV